MSLSPVARLSGRGVVDCETEDRLGLYVKGSEARVVLALARASVFVSVLEIEPADDFHEQGLATAVRAFWCPVERRLPQRRVAAAVAVAALARRADDLPGRTAPQTDLDRRDVRGDVREPIV
jgi:hypothetical protein